MTREVQAKRATVEVPTIFSTFCQCHINQYDPKYYPFGKKKQTTRPRRIILEEKKGIVEIGAQRSACLVSKSIYINTQNHSMIGLGRDLCGSSSPTPLPKQGHPQQAASDHVHAGLEYLQRRLHNLLRQPVPGLRHPQREEVLPPVRAELPLLQFVPIAPCPVTGHH